MIAHTGSQGYEMFDIYQIKQTSTSEILYECIPDEPTALLIMHKLIVRNSELAGDLEVTAEFKDPFRIKHLDTKRK